MMYQIALKFDSAKSFAHKIVTKDNKDKILMGEHTMFEFGGLRSATEADYTICPDDTLPLHCVANAIAVLCGDRPVPTKRKHSPSADYEAFAKYVDMARRARIRIDTVPNNQSVMQTAKLSMYSLSSTDLSVKQQKTSAVLVIDGVANKLIRACPSHETLPCVWGLETYKAFDNMCETVIGTDYKSRMNVLETLTELREQYKKANKTVLDFFKAIPTVTVTERDLVDPVVRGVVGGSIFRGETWGRYAELKSWGAPVSVHGTPAKTWTACGMIFLQVTADEAEMLLAGPEMATLLDGGSLYPSDKDGDTGFDSWRETVIRWDERNDLLPVPFE